MHATRLFTKAYHVTKSKGCARVATSCPTLHSTHRALLASDMNIYGQRGLVPLRVRFDCFARARLKRRKSGIVPLDDKTTALGSCPLGTLGTGFGGIPAYP